MQISTICWSLHQNAVLVKNISKTSWGHTLYKDLYIIMILVLHKKTVIQMVENKVSMLSNVWSGYETSITCVKGWSTGGIVNLKQDEFI